MKFPPRKGPAQAGLVALAAIACGVLIYLPHFNAWRAFPDMSETDQRRVAEGLRNSTDDLVLFDAAGNARIMPARALPPLHPGPCLRSYGKARTVDGGPGDRNGIGFAEFSCRMRIDQPAGPPHHTVIRTRFTLGSAPPHHGPGRPLPEAEARNLLQQF